MDGFSPMQHGTAGDITAGLPLGPWTEALAQTLMKRNELSWDERGIRGSEREKCLRADAERYRNHIAAGDLCYAYVDYPYVEWYSENGRVVLELDPSQVESFLTGIVEDLSRENRNKGGDGNVTGIVVS